jgi:hypothetical protein
MKTKKIYQKLFPWLSYESEPLMDGILLSCGFVCLMSAIALVAALHGIY